MRCRRLTSRPRISSAIGSRRCASCFLRFSLRGGDSESIDFDKLRLELGDVVEDGDERYAFTWPGKKDAIRQSQTVSTATLRPCVEKSRGRTGEDGSFDSDNVYIEGDNLEALKLLQRAYHGKVKLIYIDPPYNTGHDFVYHDSFGDSIENYKEQAGLTGQSNPDTSGSYHSAWCSMMYPRLKLARELLSDDGALTVSIDDNEIANLLQLLSEIFGKSQIRAIFPRVTKRAGKSSEDLASNHDYVILVAKGPRTTFFPPEQDNSLDYPFSDEHFESRGPYKLNQCLDYDSLQYSESLDYPIEYEGEILYPGGDLEAYQQRHLGRHARADWAWRWSKEKYEFGLREGFIIAKKGRGRTRLYTKTYLNAKISEIPNGSKNYKVVTERRTLPLSTLTFDNNDYSNDNANKRLASLFDGKKYFDYSKPTSLISSLIEFCTSRGDYVLDFFSGSGTTAQAVFEVSARSSSRHFLLVQLPETLARDSPALLDGYSNICQLGEERIHRAGDKIKAELEESNRQLKLGEEPKKLPDIGFRVFKLDESGIRKPEEGQLLVDRVKPGRTDLDIIFEMMLKWGLELTYPVEREEVNGYPVYSVACDELICCMQPGLTVETLEAIAQREPRRVFLLDSVIDDTIKLNALQIFKRVEERTQQKIDLRTV